MSTTFYTFHRWIEPSSTSNTVVLTYGGWWNADAEAPSLNGSTEIIFAASGSLSGIGSVAGSTGVGFTAHGSLTAIANLSGQSQLAFTTDGQLSGLAALSGTSDLAFSATAKPSGIVQIFSRRQFGPRIGTRQVQV